MTIVVGRLLCSEKISLIFRLDFTFTCKSKQAASGTVLPGVFVCWTKFLSYPSISLVYLSLGENIKAEIPSQFSKVSAARWGK